MKVKILSAVIASTLLIGCALPVVKASQSAIKSIETNRTVTKVRTGMLSSGSSIITTSYEGTVAAFNFNGQKLWENELSGFMNHDIWVQDINGDGLVEVFAANADGNVYCINSDGSLKWTFGLNEVPMNSVTVISDADNKYVVAGGYDKNLYYISTDGELLKTIESKTYSEEGVFGDGVKPEAGTHTVNFVRPIKSSDGTEKLVVLGTNNSLQSSGRFYIFEPFADLPSEKSRVLIKKGIGDLRTVDFDNDGNDELTIGNSAQIGDAAISVMDLSDLSQKKSQINDIARQIDRFGYRVAQTEVVINEGISTYLTLFGSRILLTPESFDVNDSEILASKYSYYDIWKDKDSNKILLASAQSGGSQVHIIDTSNPDWKNAYKELEPQGKLAAIQNNTRTIERQLSSFQKPIREREPLPVYFISESRNDIPDTIERSESLYDSPVFLNYSSSANVENWDRSEILADNPKYRDKRDRRKNYTLSPEEMFNQLSDGYENSDGISQWAGHGNDPYMISLATMKRIISSGEGKKTVNIYPEVEGHGEAFYKVLNDHFYPLAKFSSENNANLFMRNKHTFWQSTIYAPEWLELRSGRLADAFVPAMEETTDKSMEISVAGRMGLWAAGSVDDWGERYARDNPSFDRLRQHSHQMVPNHALRQIIYKLASGARYINNFGFNQEYMSLAWELIGKGALYVPKRDELLSLSPVHISMKEPDPVYRETSNNVKWTTFYDEEKESVPYVFSRLNGTWPGAKTLPWDYSSYAADTKERRLDFIPKFPKGLVLITPVQQGKFKDEGTVRGALADNMHPIYKNIMKEYITDGKSYFDPNGENVMAADSIRYKQIRDKIEEKSNLLPMTVSGETAWVVAQSDKKHLRLTLVDSGYLNPGDKIAKVKFNSVTPETIVDILSGEIFSPDSNGVVEIPVLAGAFRFIDVKITEDIRNTESTSM